MEGYNVKRYLENAPLKPIVFRKLPPVLGWKVSRMDVEELGKMLGEKKLKFRIGSKNSESIQWEGDCKYIGANLHQFNEFLSSNGGDNSFGVGHDKHWAYADYIYVRDLFESVPNFNVLDFVGWRDIGFTGDEGKDSAIWIGSQGAHTVCHYDTYGYNLVLQVSGRKRWVLFPPEDTSNLYPTRIPYEESSVFSKVNLLQPDLNQHPKFRSSHPRIITLEPGDMLYVPKHWWHSVENLQLSISVNAWLPMESDRFCRIHEAASKLIISSISSNPGAWFNPNESPLTVKDGVNLLQLAISDYNETRTLEESENIVGNTKSEGNTEHELIEASDGKLKFSNRNSDLNFKNLENFKPEASNTFKEGDMKSCICGPNNLTEHEEKFQIFPVKEYCFEHCAEEMKKWDKIQNLEIPRKKLKRSEKELTFQNFVECLTSPTVVESLVREILNRVES